MEIWIVMKSLLFGKQVANVLKFSSADFKETMSEYPQ